jgi:hypothetical protein
LEEGEINMPGRSKYLTAGLAGLLILLSSQLPAWAKNQHAFLAPGFQFDQIDTLCVMPTIDARQGKWVDIPPTQEGGFDYIWPDLMWRLQRKGYRVADPSCSRDPGPNAAPQKKWRWVLTARLSDFEAGVVRKKIVMGLSLSASLVDTESGKEVWRDKELTGQVGELNYGLWDILSTIEKRKNPLPPSPDNIWAPVSMPTRLYKFHTFAECNGLIRLDSGTLSFDPSNNGTHDDKCANFQFSVPAASVKWDGWLIIPEKGRFALQKPDATQILFFNLALASYR